MVISMINRSSGGHQTARSALKWILAGLIIFIGVSAGIYTGLALSQQGYGLPAGENSSNLTYLEIGQEFPNYSLRDASNGRLVTVSELSNQGPVLLVFVSSGCGACVAMEQYWRRKVFDQLDSQIQLIWVYDSTETIAANSLPAEYGVRIVQTARRSQSDEDGITATPTLIGLNRDRRIQFIVVGFDRNVRSDFINDLV